MNVKSFEKEILILALINKSLKMYRESKIIKKFPKKILTAPKKRELIFLIIH